MKKNVKLLALFLVLAAFLVMGSMALAQSSNNSIVLELDVPYYGYFEDYEIISFEFTPSVSGEYEFYLQANFSAAYLYDNSMNFIAGDGPKVDPVDFRAYLDASNTYYIEISTVSPDQYYTLTVSYYHGDNCSFNIGPYHGEHLHGYVHDETYYCSCSASQTTQVSWIISCHYCNDKGENGHIQSNVTWIADHFVGSGHGLHYKCSYPGCEHLYWAGFITLPNCNLSPCK